MAGISGVAVTGSDGVVYIEHRDTDANALVRRFRAPDDAQPARVRFERELEERYADWQRWRNTRLEAQTRGLAGNIINALTNRENSAWNDYTSAIQEWRNL